MMHSGSCICLLVKRDDSSATGSLVTLPKLAAGQGFVAEAVATLDELVKEATTTVAAVFAVSTSRRAPVIVPANTDSPRDERTRLCKALREGIWGRSCNWGKQGRSAAGRGRRVSSALDSLGVSPGHCEFKSPLSTNYRA